MLKIAATGNLTNDVELKTLLMLMGLKNVDFDDMDQMVPVSLTPATVPMASDSRASFMLGMLP